MDSTLLKSIDFKLLQYLENIIQFYYEQYTNYVKQRKKKNQEIFQKPRCAIILALIQ